MFVIWLLFLFRVHQSLFFRLAAAPLSRNQCSSPLVGRTRVAGKAGVSLPSNTRLNIKQQVDEMKGPLFLSCFT